MKWQRIIPVQIILQVFVVIISSADVQPKSRFLDLLTGITRTSRDVIIGTMGKVRDLIQPDDSVLFEFFDYCREKMKEDNSEYDVPVLDPFHTEYLGGDIVNEITGNVTMHLGTINITGLSDFKFKRVKMNWLPRKLDLDLQWREVECYGVYNVSGLLGHMIPLFGSGPAKLRLKNVNITSVASLGTLNNFVYIKHIDLDFSVEEIEVMLTDLMGGGRLGELVNKALSVEGPRILDLVRVDLTEFGGSWLSSNGNHILQKMNVTFSGITHFMSTVATKKVQSFFNFNPTRTEL